MGQTRLRPLYAHSHEEEYFVLSKPVFHIEPPRVYYSSLLKRDFSCVLHESLIRKYQPDQVSHRPQ